LSKASKNLSRSRAGRASTCLSSSTALIAKH
jgi:hypothetical protein